MKKLIHPVTITLMVVVFLFSLPFLVPKKAIEILSDNALREKALSGQMLPIPRTYSDLLRVIVDNSTP